MSDSTITNTNTNTNPVKDLLLDIHRTVLSESKFHNKTDLSVIARHLRTIRATGKLTINFSQGGLNSITFEARHTLNGSDHVELKFEGD